MAGKARQRESECAAEHCLREHWGVVKSVRAVSTKWQRQDLFAADVLGKTAAGDLVACQVTTGTSANVAQRRRKLEDVPWAPQDVVLLFEYRETKEGRRKRYWFRVHYLTPREPPEWESHWAVEDEMIEINRKWFKAWKPEQ